MSFWKSEMGEITGKEEDAFIKDFIAIPNNTMALAKIVVFCNHTVPVTQFGGGYDCLKIEWQITEGHFQGFKLKQELKVFGNPNAKDSENTKYKALNMLKLIYNIFNINLPPHEGCPTNQELSVFCGKIAGIKIRELINDKGYRNNWVAEVHSSHNFKSEIGSPIAEHSSKETKNYKDYEKFMESAYDRRPQESTNGIALDDDIPF